MSEQTYCGKTAREIANDIEQGQLSYTRHVDEDGHKAKRATVTVGHRIMGIAEEGEQKKYQGRCHLFGYTIAEAGTRNTVGKRLKQYRIDAWRERAELSRERPRDADIWQAIQVLRDSVADEGERLVDVERDAERREEVGEYALGALTFYGGTNGTKELLCRWADGLWSPHVDAQVSLYNLMWVDPMFAHLWAKAPESYDDWCKTIGARLAEIARA